MQINIQRSQKLLLILFMLGGGAALWHATRLPLASVSREVALQTQWRRVMALRIPAGDIPGARIDKQPFSPIAIPLTGVRLIAWRPQGNGGEMELTLPWQTVPAFCCLAALRDESALVLIVSRGAGTPPASATGGGR